MSASMARPSQLAFWKPATCAGVLVCALILAAQPPAVVGESVLAPSSLSVSDGGSLVVLNPIADVVYTARLTSSDENFDVQSSSTAGSPPPAYLELGLSFDEVPVELPSGEYLLVVMADDALLMSQTVAVRGNDPFLLLETDKPVYQPGAKIHVRVLCLLRSSMKQCSEQQSARILLDNPQGTKVLAVEGAEMAPGSGVLEGSLQLDSRAPLGTYTVIVEGGDNLAAEIKVAVDEYVLPKFEVSVSVADDTLPVDSTAVVKGTVSAVYSYGAGVEGTAHIKLKMFQWGCSGGGGDTSKPMMPFDGAAIDYGDPEPDVDMPPRNGGFAADGEVDHGNSGSTTRDSGCDYVIAETSGAELNQQGDLDFELAVEEGLLGHSQQLILEVSVTETATDTTADTEMGLKSAPYPYHTLNLRANRTFYPGLYIDFEITSKMSDGTAVDGTAVVTVEFGYFLPDEATAEVRSLPEPVTVQATVTNGVGTARIKAPKQQQDCCLAAFSSGNPQDDMAGTSCCLDVVNPSMVFTNKAGSTQDVYTGCVEPAFPPRAAYLTVALSEEAGSSSDVIALVVTATGDITGRPLMYVVTAWGSHLSTAPVQWSAASYDAAADITTGSFEIPKTAEMVPEAHVVVTYEADDGSLTLGRTPVHLQSPEDLTMLQSPSVAIDVKPEVQPEIPRDPFYYKPGENAALTLKADNANVVFFGAIDRSVTYLTEEETRATPSRMMQELRRRAVPSTDSRGNSKEDHILCNAPVVLDAAGLMLGTRKGHPDACPPGEPPSRPMCGYRWSDDYMNFGGVPEMEEVADGDAEPKPGQPTNKGEQGADGDVTPPDVKVRTKFPETWLWSFALIDPATGEASILKAVPDTITTWELSAFSVGPDRSLGFSIGEPTEVVVFQPLFVELKLPYKVVRGETLEVVASVFNYQAASQDINLQLTVPEGVAVSGEPSQTLSVEGNSAQSLRVNITFSQLGEVELQLQGTGSSADSSDSLVRTLKVVPEGFPQESAVNVILSPPESGAQELTVPVQVGGAAEDLVPGSEYATLMLAGELLAPSMDGLGALVRFPTGCGEQNMITLAPTVYVMRYLESRGSTRPELREKALNFIQVGYSRELEYKHPDGSFSAFGTSDDSGSTWLTAFVLKVFSQAHAAELLDVPKDIAEAASQWLVESSQDGESGQFLSRGKVIHSEMVGGVNEDEASVSLTAFVTGALLEAQAAGLLPDDAKPGLSAAVAYLISAPRTTNYAKVLVAHTLAIAEAAAGIEMPDGLPQAAESAFSDMQEAAITEGSMKHWAPKDVAVTPPEGDFRMVCPGCNMPHGQALDVEMTGYALSAIVERIGSDALAEGLPVQAWLVAERSQHGGWVSTQDTTVALEGLSRHADLASDNPPELTVTVSYPVAEATQGRRRLSQDGAAVEEKTLTVNADNYDIVQKLEVPVGGNISISVSGTGQAAVTVGTSWNTKSRPAEPTFAVKTKGWQQNHGRPGVALEFEVSRLSGAEDGMVMANMQVFSGMVPKPESLEAMANSKAVCNGAVKRVEYENDQVSVYIDRLASGEEPCVVKMELDQEAVVEDLQPATVEVFEYYNPQNAGAAELAAADLADSPPKAGNGTDVVGTDDDTDGDGKDVGGDDDSAASRPVGARAMFLLLLVLPVAAGFL